MTGNVVYTIIAIAAVAFGVVVAFPMYLHMRKGQELGYGK